MAAATLEVERMGFGYDKFRGGRVHAPIVFPFWAYSKGRINHGATGTVFLAKGSCIAPTESTEELAGIANPYCGDILDGFPVLVVPASIDRYTGDFAPYYVAPIPVLYYAKNDAPIAAEVSGTFSIWIDGADSGENITDVYYGWPATATLASSTKCRIAWDQFKQRHYVEASAC